MVHGRAIGVLQTINKRDGSIFVQEDADLLETFAGQAAIAIENARLFDMTDQQLALRVQELDTMQRIDQELNRTLNLDNVVDITMDWALRKSGATAGALFILDRETQRTAGRSRPTAIRRTSPLGQRRQPSFPADRGVVGRVIRTGQPSLITDVSIDPDYDGDAARLYRAVDRSAVQRQSGDRRDHPGKRPGRRTRPAGPGLCRSSGRTRQPGYRQLAAFPANSNSANQDKSEFVSLVAHELKNPMTSMKGYTDLLLKGVVGPVNEQQSDFLKTILNNVNRMETLVSDLNDLTKQQTGNMRLEIFPVDFRNVRDRNAARACSARSKKKVRN